MPSLGNKSFQGFGLPSDLARRLEDLSRQVSVNQEHVTALKSSAVDVTKATAIAQAIAQQTAAPVLNISNATGTPGTGLVDPGANGILKRTAKNITAIATAADIPQIAGSTIGYANLSLADVSVPNTVLTPIPFDTNVLDVGGVHSTSVNPTRFTVPAGQGGFYFVCGSIRWAALSVSGANYTAIEIFNNGSVVAANSLPASGTVVIQSLGLIVPLAAGDIVEIYARQTSGGVATVQAFATQTWGQIFRIA
jgi:hypothetical protein